MDNLEIAKALFQQKSATKQSSGQTTTAYGTAMSDSSSGAVMVNLGGDTVSPDDDQMVELETTFAVKDGDQVIVSLVGADGTGKAPVVTGVVGRGDETEAEIEAIKNYFWTDEHGAHVSTEEQSVQGANVLLDSDSLDIRYGNSNSESDQTVYASFGREVTVGTRAAGTIGQFSQVHGRDCVASGNYSHAEGYGNTSAGSYSHVEGRGNTSYALASHVEGYSNTLDFAGSEAHVEGSGNSVHSGRCHVEGGGNTVTGMSTHVEGTGNTVNASSDSSVLCSHVEGTLNTLNSDAWYCHCEGSSNVINGPNTLHAHVEGRMNIASSSLQHVQGEYNVEDANGTYADIIGCGNGLTRRNAYNLDWSGNAEFRGSLYEGGCTPNGETPYPVVRYNTSLSRSEYWNGSAWTEVPGGGGGSAFAYIVANYPAGSTCTATSGGTTITAADTSGTFVFEVQTPGTWVITSTDGVNTESESVVISSHYQVEFVSVYYNLWLIRNGVFTSDYTRTLYGYSSATWTEETGGYASLYVPRVSSSYSTGYFSDVDVTDYNYLVCESKTNGYSDAAKYCPAAGVINALNRNANPTTFTAWVKLMSGGTTANYTEGTFYVDISSITGTKNVGLQVAGSNASNTSAECQCFNLYLSNVLPN